MVSTSEAAEELLAHLARAPHRALFVTELRSRLRGPAGDGMNHPADHPADHLVDQIVGELDGSRLLVLDHPRPDPHLDGDLRVVALVGTGGAEEVAAARQAADRVFTTWLREVLSQHRCG